MKQINVMDNQLERFGDKAKIEELNRVLNDEKVLNKRDLELINKYHNYNAVRLRLHSQIFYIKSLIQLLKQKELKDFNEEFLINFLTGKKSADRLKKILIYFFEWNKTPKFVKLAKFLKDFKIKNGNRKLTSEDILTKEDIAKMVNATQNIKHRAIIHVLFESCLRASEFLNLRIRDIKITDYGAELNIRSSKTPSGIRKVYLIESASLLKQYLELHSFKTDTECPLWLARYENQKHPKNPLTYAGLNELIKIISKRANLGKRVWLHLFRHSKATSLLRDEQMPTSLVQQITGHSNLQSLQIYSHLSQTDARDFLLEKNGFINSKEKDKTLDIKICNRCSTKNSYNNLYCSGCNLPIAPESIIKQEDEKEKAWKIMNSILDNELKELIKKKIECLKS